MQSAKPAWRTLIVLKSVSLAKFSMYSTNGQFTICSTDREPGQRPALHVRHEPGLSIGHERNVRRRLEDVGEEPGRLVLPRVDLEQRALLARAVAGVGDVEIATAVFGSSATAALPSRAMASGKVERRDRETAL
jgi:hypothetical protein